MYSGNECTSGTPPWPAPGTIPCPEGYIGLAWLSAADGETPSASQFEGALDLLNLWEPMTGGVNPALTSGVPLDPSDYKFIVATEPFDLASGETRTEAYGIVMGAGFANMVINADTMRAVYASLTDEAIEDPADGAVPRVFALQQNYPNPFNRMTTIRFALPNREHVTLKIFDVLGREVAELLSEQLRPGR